MKNKMQKYKISFKVGCLLILTMTACNISLATSSNLHEQIPLCNSDIAPSFEVAFSPSQDTTKLIISTIGKAEKYVYVAAYYFTSMEVANALNAAQQRGIEIKIVLDKSQFKKSNKNSKSNTDDEVINFFNVNKLPYKICYKYRIMHNKFMIIDGKTVQLGSFNYTNSAEDYNAENVLVIYDSGQLANIYLIEWNKLWNESIVVEANLHE